MLTSAGKAFLAIGIVALGVGVPLGYHTLTALGIAFLASVVIGRLWIIRRPRVSATRVVVPERVRSGRPARSHLTIVNRGRRTTAGGIALEQFGDSQLPIELPSLEPGAEAVITTELPTDTRGAFRVGPLDVTRADPFGLVQTGQADEGVSRLWVHPLIHELYPFPSGIARDLEGPDSGEALEAGITFHTLRDYVRGDDLRLVHWRSSARSGKLMVRHNVDTNHPRSLVVLDTRATSYTADTFEDAVRATASIVMASVSRGFEFRLITTDGIEMNQQMVSATILDRLAEIGPSFRGSIEEVFNQLRADRGGLSLAVVTGAIPAEELAPLSRFRPRFESITVAQFAGDRGEWDRGIPNATLISAETSEEFARAWNQVSRR